MELLDNPLPAAAAAQVPRGWKGLGRRPGAAAGSGVGGGGAGPDRARRAVGVRLGEMWRAAAGLPEPLSLNFGSSPSGKFDGSSKTPDTPCPRPQPKMPFN